MSSRRTRSSSGSRQERSPAWPAVWIGHLLPGNTLRPTEGGVSYDPQYLGDVIERRAGRSHSVDPWRCSATRAGCGDGKKRWWSGTEQDVPRWFGWWELDGQGEHDLGHERVIRIRHTHLGETRSYWLDIISHTPDSEVYTSSCTSHFISYLPNRTKHFKLQYSQETVQLHMVGAAERRER